MSDLGGGAHFKRPEYDVHHSLGREHVSPDHCCILGRLEDGAGGDDDFDWSETTLKYRKKNPII